MFESSVISELIYFPAGLVSNFHTDLTFALDFETSSAYHRHHKITQAFERFMCSSLHCSIDPRCARLWRSVVLNYNYGIERMIAEGSKG